MEQTTLFYSLKKYFSNMSITSVNFNFILYDLGKKLKSIVSESFFYIQIKFNFSFIVTKILQLQNGLNSNVSSKWLNLKQIAGGFCNFLSSVPLTNKFEVTDGPALQPCITA